MSFSSFSYRSPKKFKSTVTNSSKTSTKSTTTTPSKEWNAYLTDDHKFRLSNEEILRKKQQIISKHNIFLNPSPPVMKKPKIKKNKPRDQRFKKEDTDHEIDNFETGLTSLDLLDASEPELTDDEEDEIEYHDEDHSATKIKKVALRSSENQARSFKVSRSGSKTPPQTKKTQPQLPHASLKDLKDITTMIQALHQELKYYEELSGRRSFLDVNELNSVIELSSDESISFTTTMRYLVQLVCLISICFLFLRQVCQTMSYLLKSEIELNKQRENYTQLSGRVDQLFYLQQQSLKQIPLFNNIKSLDTTPTTPSTAISTSEFVGTHKSDKTVNLYEKDARMEYATPSSDLSTSRNSTPYNPDASELTPATRKKGQVTFSFPSPSDSTPSPSATESIPFRESKLGTSSTDWLFQTTKEILTNHTSQGSRSNLSTPSADTNTQVATESPPVDTPPMYPPNRLIELHQQIAIMKHDVSGVKGYGITSDRHMTPPPSTTSSSFSAYHSDPLKQWLKWTGESPKPTRGVMSVRPMNPLDDLNNLSIPPPPPPSSHHGESTKTIHMPRAPIPPKDIVEESDHESDDDKDEIPLHQIYNSNNIPTPSSRLASYKEDSSHAFQSSNEHEEAPSQHVIPSTSLPTPEMAPQHPRNANSSTSQYHIPTYPTSARSPSSSNSSYMQVQRSYDARNGSYGGR